MHALQSAGGGGPPHFLSLRRKVRQARDVTHITGSTIRYRSQSAREVTAPTPIGPCT